MIGTLHQDPSTGRCWYTYCRENWLEWFSFRCHPDYIAEFRRISPIGWLYISLEWDSYTLDRWMLIAPLAVFVFIGRFIRSRWFDLARIIFKLGFLTPPPPGDMIHWFWPRYFSLHGPRRNPNP